MSRFHGVVGYGQQVESVPGVWVEEITERSYFGNVIRDSRNLREGENLNSDLSVSNSISVVADAHAYQQFTDIRYVEWHGIKWTVTEVEVQRPRLILRLGEVYSGPTP